MSIDLDWAQLDKELCERALAGINNALQSTTKPGFLGDIQATSFSFGHVSPEIEIVEIREVFDEFLNIDDDDEDNLRENESNYSKTFPVSPTSFGAFPNRSLGPPSLYSSHHRAGLWMGSRNGSISSASTPNLQALSAGTAFPRASSQYHDHHSDRRSNASSSVYVGGRQDTSPLGPPSDPNSEMSVQIHIHVKYAGNLSIALQSSLQVNYPSFAFMSLPLALRLSGVAFEGTLVVAYEGDRKRLHVSLLDDDKLEVAAGSRLLRNVTVESEVGQADKLVLKDVQKVEQFVLDAARKGLQDEIAWPNFQSFAWT